MAGAGRPPRGVGDDDIGLGHFGKLLGLALAAPTAAGGLHLRIAFGALGFFFDFFLFFKFLFFFPFFLVVFEDFFVVSPFILVVNVPLAADPLSLDIVVDSTVVLFADKEFFVVLVLAEDTVVLEGMLEVVVKRTPPGSTGNIRPSLAVVGVITVELDVETVD